MWITTELYSAAGRTEDRSGPAPRHSARGRAAPVQLYTNGETAVNQSQLPEVDLGASGKSRIACQTDSSTGMPLAMLSLRTWRTF